MCDILIDLSEGRQAAAAGERLGQGGRQAGDGSGGAEAIIDPAMEAAVSRPAAARQEASGCLR